MSEEKISKKAEEKKEAKPEPAPPKKSKRIALIRVRGVTGVKRGISDTLKMLNLFRVNNCVVMDVKDNTKGMIQKVKDFITWGEISPETESLLKEKKKCGKCFNLSPPRGGYERKGIKVPFKIGGVLGYRGDKINDLIKRMV